MDIEKLVREYIAKTVHMSLATSRDNKPWVSEVHFAFDDKLNLYFRSLTMRRHSQEIAANPHVAGNIVKQHTLDETGIGLYFEGTARMLETVDERKYASRWIIDRLRADESIVDEALDPNKHQFYMITVHSFYVFGKFEDDGAKKYELPWQGSALSTNNPI